MNTMTKAVNLLLPKVIPCSGTVAVVVVVREPGDRTGMMTTRLLNITNRASSDRTIENYASLFTIRKTTDVARGRHLMIWRQTFLRLLFKINNIFFISFGVKGFVVQRL